MTTNAEGAPRLEPIVRRLAVRPHPRREMLRLPEELQIGWLVGDKFMAFAACKNAAAFDTLLVDAKERYGEFELVDMRA